jgi:hypothetical protein
MNPFILVEGKSNDTFPVVFLLHFLNPPHHWQFHQLLPIESGISRFISKPNQKQKAASLQPSPSLRLCQITSVDALTESKMIRFARMCINGNNKVSQTITICELSKKHTQQLIPVEKMPDILIAIKL